VCGAPAHFFGRAGGARPDERKKFQKSRIGKMSLSAHAGAAMERSAQSGDGEAVGRLRAFTHPSHFGAKFQVLHGIR
jgi:hypothetical protein